VFACAFAWVGGWVGGCVVVNCNDTMKRVC